MSDPEKDKLKAQVAFYEGYIKGLQSARKWIYHSHSTRGSGRGSEHISKTVLATRMFNGLFEPTVYFTV